MVKFLHLADLHLDTPFIGLGKYNVQLQERLLKASQDAFERGVSIAIKQEVDFVIIVGDLYDTRRQTVASQNFFMQQVKRLETAGIDLILSYGNHDYQSPTQVPKKYPGNVHVFEGEKVTQFDHVTKSGEKIVFYGFSYQHQWIEEDLISQFPYKKNKEEIMIGVYHGQVKSGKADKDRYAPFKLEDMIEKGYDYWALGHIHQAQVLSQSPYIQYSGSIQAKTRKELGDKGGYLVDIIDGKVSSHFISLASVRFEKAKLAVNTDWDDMIFLEEVRQIMNNYREESLTNRQAYLIDIEVNHSQRLEENLLENIQSGQFLELVNEEYDASVPVQVLSLNLNVDVEEDLVYLSSEMEKAYQVGLKQLEDEHYLNQVLMIPGHGSMIKQIIREMSNDPDERAELLNETVLLFTSRLGVQKGGDNLED